MIQLKAKGISQNITETSVVKIVSENSDYEKIGVLGNDTENILLTTATDITTINENPLIQKVIFGIPTLNHLAVEDIVLLNPNGSMFTLFRKASPHNSLFITDRCNFTCESRLYSP